MKTAALFFLLIGMFCQPLAAGTISLPDFSTNWPASGQPNQTHVESSSQWTVNLDDRTGLTPGMPIRITVTTSDHFLWVGSFGLVAGPFKISTEASLGLVLGTRSAGVSSLLVKDFGIISPESAGGADSGYSDVAGYMEGPGLPVLEITVPWSTDLTQAIFRLSQVSDINGPGFSSSTLSVSGGAALSESSAFSVRFASVPEPSTGLMLGGALLMMSIRRKR